MAQLARSPLFVFSKSPEFNISSDVSLRAPPFFVTSFGCANKSHPLTCHVQDGVGLGKVLLQRFDRFGRRQNSQVDLALLSFALHFFHHWQRPSASADYKSPAFPGYFLFD